MINDNEFYETLKDYITQFGTPNGTNYSMYISFLQSVSIKNPQEAKLLELSINDAIPERLYAIKENLHGGYPHIAYDFSNKNQVDLQSTEWVIHVWLKAFGVHTMMVLPSIFDETGQIKQLDPSGTNGMISQSVYSGYPSGTDSQQQNHQIPHNQYSGYPPFPESTSQGNGNLPNPHITMPNPERPSTLKNNGFFGRVGKRKILTLIAGISMILVLAYVFPTLGFTSPVNSMIQDFSEDISGIQDVSGKWIDTDGLVINLYQEGNQVKGNFLLSKADTGGSRVDVEFSGTLSEKTLPFRYNSEVLKNGAISQFVGEGKIVFSNSLTEGDMIFYTEKVATIEFERPEQPMIMGEKYPIHKVSAGSGTHGGDTAAALDGFIQEGAELANNGYYSAAVESFDKALEIDPKNAEVWGRKGGVLSRSKRYEESVEAFDKALEFDPQNAEIMGAKAANLVLLGKYSEGRELAYETLEIDPTNSRAMTVLSYDPYSS